MGQTLPNTLPTDETDQQKYDACMNDLLEFLEEWHGTVDLQALRLLCAAVWQHLFTDGEPLWLWVSRPPRKLDIALGLELGRLMHAPHPGTVAGELESQRNEAKSLWVLNGHEALFHRTPGEIELSLRQLAAIQAGECEWNPRLDTNDEFSGPDGRFTWNGRVTVIACLQRDLDRLQQARMKPLWPIVQNSVVTIRFSLHSVRSPFIYRWLGKDEFVIGRLRRLFANLLDRDHRNRRYRAKRPESLFEPLQFLGVLVGALRGPGFDTELLESRAIALALGHASLMAKPEADAEDYALARKVMLDAIPVMSTRMLRVLPMQGWFSSASIERRLTGGSNRAIREAVESLHENGALERRKNTTVAGKRHGDRAWLYTAGAELQRALMAGV